MTSDDVRRDGRPGDATSVLDADVRRLSRDFKHPLISSALGVVILGAALCLVAGVDIKFLAGNIGVGLLASVAFGVFFTIQADRTSKDFLTRYFSAFQDAAKGLAKDISQDARELNRRFAPTEEFLESDTSQSDHNERLIADLSETSTYCFRGLTGYYVPLRINQSGARLARLEMLLATPQARSAELSDAMNEDVNPEFRGLNPKDEAEEVRNRMVQTIAGLYFDLHDSVTVRIAFGSVPFVRLEITDAAVYRSLYPPKATKRKFPTTYRFPRDTVTYQESQLEFAHQFAEDLNPLVFDHTTNFESMLAKLAAKGFTVTREEFLVLKEHH